MSNMDVKEILAIYNLPWYIGTFVGVLSLVTLNSLERVYGMSWKTFLLLLPILICCNQGFWWGFNNAPNFMFCWIVGSIMASSLGWLSSMYILKEPFNVWQISGYFIALLGLIIMKAKG